MPTKRTFDVVVITVILLHPAVGLLRMAARRWSNESNGALGLVGDTVKVAL